ncbi:MULTISPECIES: hypothetical protein [unclassified Paenibacillus]|uniref:hypothetical protein n=1 Tax=unclassified Paenibacillus TaxID=185978 RepID=UPI000953EB6B|nr:MULTISPECIES: hypothetical protein [unclassified Paenibacillus]QID16058.1 hypothetical protein CIC07_25340 [Paenibacillus sp. RUD330]SIR09478.1 hypothetical protein SAMN05880555_2996 [Paenibacillus sp. RU4X]SIR27223.1 hypothetical protein SAMN05880570_3004 [Paenibacillus sp. RU4T]
MKDSSRSGLPETEAVLPLSAEEAAAGQARPEAEEAGHEQAWAAFYEAVRSSVQGMRK